MTVIPSTDHHVGDIRSYLLKVNEVTPLLKSLISELKTITKGVEPDEAYANTLMNLANRMQMNEAVLLKGLGVQPKDSLPQITSTSKASLTIDGAWLGFPPVLRQDYRNFL